MHEEINSSWDRKLLSTTGIVCLSIRLCPSVCEVQYQLCTEYTQTEEIVTFITYWHCLSVCLSVSVCPWVCLSVYLSVRQAPSYLADDCQLVSDIRPLRLRSSDSGFCAIRRSRTTYGDRCFAAAGPRVWNSLPTELRQSDSLAQFKRRLKTHLFGLWDHSTLWHWLLVN